MKNYTVMGTVTCTVGIRVVAEDEEEAMQIASEEFGGVWNLAGNGGTDKIVGVNGKNEFIECDDTPVWDWISERAEDEFSFYEYDFNDY